MLPPALTLCVISCMKYRSNSLVHMTCNVASPGGRVLVARPEGNLATWRVSADPWALNGPRGLVKYPQIMKSTMMACMRYPLGHGILWPMYSPAGAAAFHGCRLIIPCGKQDAGPNELIVPEISMENHKKNILSFTLIRPAIFPAQKYLLVPV